MKAVKNFLTGAAYVSLDWHLVIQRTFAMINSDTTVTYCDVVVTGKRQRHRTIDTGICNSLDVGVELDRLAF